MKSFSLGDIPEMNDELLRLVLEGKKRATSWAAIHGDEGIKIGDRQIIEDSSGNPRIVIEVIELTCLPFQDIDAAFARDEGEEDLSLKYWRQEHQRYFTQEGTFSPDMKVFCQRFKIIEIL